MKEFTIITVTILRVLTIIAIVISAVSHNYISPFRYNDVMIAFGLSTGETMMHHGVVKI